MSRFVSPLVAVLLALASLHVAAARSARSVTHASPHSAALMLVIINHDREAHNLPALRPDLVLARVALAHSIDMAQHGYFSHISPTGATPFTRIQAAGIQYSVAGENLGYDAGSPHALMLRNIETAMLHSPEHRANLLRASFTRVGIGVAATGSRLYVTEDFTG